MDELQQALFDAIEANDLEAVRRCVEQGAYLGRWSRCGCCAETPLHVAINANSGMDIIKYLVSAGVDVNEGEFSSERTPLHYAVSKNNVEAVKYLVSVGADVNAGDGDGNTPLYYATSLEISEFLTVAKSRDQCYRYTIDHPALNIESTDTLFLELKSRFFLLLAENDTLREFEDWVYETSQLENLFKSQDYISLLELDYSAASAIYDIAVLVKNLLDSVYRVKLESR